MRVVAAPGHRAENGDLELDDFGRHERCHCHCSRAREWLGDAEVDSATSLVLKERGWTS